VSAKLRVASLAPSHTELVYSLGAQDQLVAVTSYCNWPSEAQKLPQLKGWTTLKAADVAALKPDLVLTSSVCQAKLLDDLKEAGLRVLHQDPRSLADVTQSIAFLGEVLGRAEEGRTLAADFKAGLDALRAAVPTDALRPRVYVEEWHQPPMAAGNWVPDLVRLVGGEPFLLPPGSLSRELSWEELMEFDPQLVVYSLCGIGLKQAPEEFLKVEGWDKTEAARKRAVFSIDDDLFNRPGPRLLEGGRLLQHLIGEAYWGWDKVNSPALRRLAP
jgi:iron complex transport system substrate-binding protein